MGSLSALPILNVGVCQLAVGAFLVLIVIRILRIVNMKTRYFRIYFEREETIVAFADNINRICAERGTNLTAVVKKVKGSSSFVTAINKGSLPKENDLIELARELNCSVIDFFADEDDLATAHLSDDEHDILNVYRSLSRRAKHEFMAMVYDFENRDELRGDTQSSAK